MNANGEIADEDEDRGIPERQARFYMAEICLALGFLHSLEIMYRDMKGPFAYDVCMCSTPKTMGNVSVVGSHFADVICK